ncbi:hypothetical protein K8R78_06385 [bacterium]|nr:hypothetical protein [bacterium]
MAGKAKVDKLKAKDPVTSVPVVKQESEIEKGLCATCLHEAYCTFPRQLNHPVRECGEFEGLEQRDVIAEKVTAILLKDTEVLCRIYDGEEDEEEADVSSTRPKERGETVDTLTPNVAEKDITRTPSKVMVPHGLCVTCKNVVDCVFPREEGKAIRFCEEFDGEVKTESKVAKPVATKPVLNEAKGLCRTCESFATCVFPKSEAGVWHCEEYK